MITPPGLTSEPACFSEEAREGPALVEKGRAGGGGGGVQTGGIYVD